MGRRHRQTGSWTVEPGRHLCFNGVQAFRLASDDNDVRKVPHVVVDGAANVIADLFNRNGVTIESIYQGHMGRLPKRPLGVAESGSQEDDWRKYSMTYGQLPPFEKFEKDIRRPNPDNSDGSAYWPEGTDYPMELVDGNEQELAYAFGNLEEFESERQRTGRNSNAHGFRGNEKQIYEFLEYLAGQWNNEGDDAAGDLASSIMTTLGYEWI